LCCEQHETEYSQRLKTSGTNNIESLRAFGLQGEKTKFQIHSVDQKKKRGVIVQKMSGQSAKTQTVKSAEIGGGGKL